jgi:S1-C subfamily serine protease
LETLILTPTAEDGFGLDIEDDCTVMAVHEHSAAEIAGVTVGVLVVKVDGQSVSSKEDIIAVLTRDDAGESSTCVAQSHDLLSLSLPLSLSLSGCVYVYVYVYMYVCACCWAK